MKLESINQALPGLPALVDMLHLGVELPHPTIIEFKNEKMLRATVLASTLLSHLTAILSSIFNQKVIALSQYSYDIIRYTGIQNARKVNITSDHTKKNGVRVEILGKKKVLNDKPTDEPEYICVLGFGQHNDRKRHSHIQASQLFFKDINAVRPASEESASAFSQALAVIQKEKPWLFARKLVFILTVTRASRTLITYNINPGMLSRYDTFVYLLSFFVTQ